jgi:hypothetical protein
MLRQFRRAPTNGFILAVCIALAIALISVLLSPPHSGERPGIDLKQNTEKSIETNQQSNHTPSAIEKSSKTDSAHRGEEITEFWTVFGRRLKITDTLLVLFTFTLWLATRDLVIGADETAQRQLRAYLTTVTGQCIRQSARPRKNGGVKFEFRPIILNTGQTPAYAVTSISDVKFLSYEEAANFKFVVPPLTSSGVVTLGSRQDRFSQVIFSRKLTWAELKQFRAGTHAFFVYGTIHYRDAFKEPRFTDYGYAVGWWPRRGDPIWRSINHNDSD